VPQPKRALIVIDVQNDYLEKHSYRVPRPWAITRQYRQYDGRGQQRRDSGHRRAERTAEQSPIMAEGTLVARCTKSSPPVRTIIL